MISSGRPCSHGTGALVGCTVIAGDLLCCHLSLWAVLSSFLVGRFVPGKIALRAIFNKDLHSCFLSRRYLISSGRPGSHGTSALVGCIVTADDLLCWHLSLWVVLSSFLVGRFAPGKIALRAIFQ